MAILEMERESRERDIVAEVGRLRAEKNLEALARLITSRDVTKRLRKTFNLTPEEWAAVHREKKNQAVARSEIQRLQKAAAYEELNRARERGNIVALILRDKTARDVVTGGTYSGVPRFRLTENERELLRTNGGSSLVGKIEDVEWNEKILQLRAGPADFWPVWTRISAGHYMSRDGWWEIVGASEGGWVIYHEDELWGEFKDEVWSPFYKPYQYKRFRSLIAAKEYIEEARSREGGSYTFLKRLHETKQQKQDSQNQARHA